MSVRRPKMGDWVVYMLPIVGNLVERPALVVIARGMECDLQAFTTGEDFRASIKNGLPWAETLPGVVPANRTPYDPTKKPGTWHWPEEEETKEEEDEDTCFHCSHSLEKHRGLSYASCTEAGCSCGFFRSNRALRDADLAYVVQHGPHSGERVVYVIGLDEDHQPIGRPADLSFRGKDQRANLHVHTYGVHDGFKEASFMVSDVPLDRFGRQPGTWHFHPKAKRTGCR